MSCGKTFRSLWATPTLGLLLFSTTIVAQPQATAASEPSRNPFLNLSSTRARSSQESLTLRGILWSPKQPYAIIGWRVVQTGDRLEGWQVAAIDATGVTLTQGNKRKRLTLR